MKHLVRINDSTPEGAGILEVLKKLPKKSIEFIGEDTGDTVSAEEFFGMLKNDVDKKFKAKNNQHTK